ncbi:cyclic nucleotide-binding domain-containing protein [Breoghania sp.]|uniref:cyclic nucleotide-binding domain-containing protein n=1 Tax=Breoghania sp. TaxID=2065378 RepID=UPI002622F875|nr:cyclic nucleotide-binding domain-containing protein [Breoghania sp.]MDJ0932202.1 cyclic nucleotide-binding domain-containing protein [Breoghania sp.]
MTPPSSAPLTSPAPDTRNRRWNEPFGEAALEAETVARILELPAFAHVSARDFPAWLPLEAIIANDGRLRRFKRGQTIIRKGDYGNSLFVILEGSIVGLAAAPKNTRAARPRRRPSWLRALRLLSERRKPPEYRPPRCTRAGYQYAPYHGHDPRTVEDIDALEAEGSSFRLDAPQMFGELAALTRSPRSASVFVAEDETLLFELRWQGLREIHDWSPVFRQQIDGLYHERGLVTRLQEYPLFDHLDTAALDEIAAHSLFETYSNFDWTQRFKRARATHGADSGGIIDEEPQICAQGNHVDGLLLINSGFARVSERVDHGARTVRHLSRNDTFGLEGIAAAQEERGPEHRASLHAIGYVDIIRIPTHLVRRLVLPNLPGRLLKPETLPALSAETETMRQGMMDFFVDHRFINGENAMVINIDRCFGCDDFVRACATAHHNNPRFVRHGYTFENAMVVNACMHCTDPICLIGYPTGAIDGTVVIQDRICIGCATCANYCPYNNIRMIDIRDRDGERIADWEGQTIARATKCDLCFDQLTGPACAQACPHDALTRINIRDTKFLMKWLA